MEHYNLKDMEELFKKQFSELKEKHPNVVLLFKKDLDLEIGSVNGRYEAFKEDADVLSEVCGVVIEGEGENKMASFSWHMLDVHLPKLIRTNHRVAICEKLTEVVKTKKRVLCKN